MTTDESQRGGDYDDEVSAGSDEPPAEERLRGAIARSGIVAWMRSHRVVASGLWALLVVAVVLVGYLVNQPPPPDPVLGIAVVAALDSSGTTSDVDAQSRPRWSSRYRVVTTGAGDAYALAGVVGPGLSDPTSSIPDVIGAGGSGGGLGATVECSDPRWWEGKDSDYRARVSRTDRYGRVLSADVLLGPPTDAYWHTRVQDTCMDAFFRSLPPSSASAVVVPEKSRVDVTVTVTNPSGHDLWLSGADAFDDDVTVTGGRRTALPAGGSATVALAITSIDNCTRGMPHVPFVTTRGGVEGTEKGLLINVSDVVSPAEGQTVTVWAILDRASANQVDSQLAALCNR